MPKKVLITGGAGFIGSNLVNFLNENQPDWSVTVIDDLSSGLSENLQDATLEFIHGTILDPKSMARWARGCDVIVHLAAIGSVPRSIESPLPTNDANITGTLNVLEAARKNRVGQVIVASSSSVYGSNPNLPRKELDWTRPMSPYAVSKLATEAYANAYSYSYGMSTLALRFFNVYGPRQRADHPYAAVIPKFVSAAISGNPLDVYGDGEQSRDFTYVESVCEAISLACAKGVKSEHPVNLAFGSNTTLNELVKLLEREIGYPLVVRHHETRQGDVRESQADASVLRSLLPATRAFDLSVGIRKTIDWFRSL